METTEKWKEFGWRAQKMVSALPVKDDRCVICERLMGIAVLDHMKAKNPVHYFMHDLQMAVFAWEEGYPLKCGYCSQEETIAVAKAELGG